MARSKQGAKPGSSTKGGGTMMGMRSGFQGLFRKHSGKGRDKDPKQFIAIAVGIFVLIVLVVGIRQLF